MLNNDGTFISSKNKYKKIEIELSDNGALYHSKICLFLIGIKTDYITLCVQTVESYVRKTDITGG